MKIAIINLIKPQKGSGDGLTEYAWNLFNKLKRENEVDLIFPLGNMRRNDIVGLLYANSFFKLKLLNMIKKDYDVIHITHPELGFAAKILKTRGSKATIVSSIHDLMRFERGYHKGLMQLLYNRIVSANIKSAIKYSDMIIFTSSAVKDIVLRKFARYVKEWDVTLIGTKDEFLLTPLKRRTMRRKQFIIGYVGSLVFRKNVIFVLETAAKLKKYGNQYKFLVYGTGNQKEHLMRYRERKHLTNLEFMGFAPEKHLMKIYDNFDAFIWPSISDSSSFPIEDARARGLPIIVYSKNKFDHEVIKQAYVANNPDDAAKRITYLKKHGYNKQMKKAGLRYAKSISWESTTRKTLLAYKRALTAKKRQL